MPIDYSALKQELRDDPAGLGYAPVTNDDRSDVRIAALMNDPKAINDKQKQIAPAKLLDIMTWAEIKLAYAVPAFSVFLGLEFINLGKNFAFRAFLEEVFPLTGSDLQTRLDRWQRFKTSRSDQLYGFDVTPTDISLARAAA